MARVAGFHLHFYQPPREDPWLGLAPNEWSAWPYRDWNERITAECYRAMVAVALERGDDGGRELFEPLVRSSFDVGPTLHRWLELHAPDVERALDHEVRNSASSANPVALAAPLVHAILPLANARDRELLVAWGIADYVQRFGEAPRGMWLPETAVDLGTLESLVRHGIEFTILMPSQAARVRDPDGAWRSVDAHSLDCSQPYLVRLASGRSITVVFGHAELSHSVAFGHVLSDGERLADMMVGALDDERDGATLVVADGETFGHHQRFGDLGLATAVRRVERHYGIETALGAWLAAQEPVVEVELATVSSWSCAHGVERWRSDCGCVTGSQPGWRQSWRAPLREALDWLRETLGGAVDAALARTVRSVDATLAAYGSVLAGALDPAAFAAAQAGRPLDAEQTSELLELCEISRHLLYSFTSCAWFFAEPSEIETAIVLRHAAVALERGSRVLGLDLAPAFVERLRAVRSNHDGVDGAAIWRAACEAHRVDEHQIAAGFAVEHLACGGSARSTRGFWRAEVEPSAAGGGDDALRITLTDTATLRRRTFLSRALRTGTLDARVEVRDGDGGEDGEASFASYHLGELGSDVIALVAASWLVGAGSVDYEAALDRMVTELLAKRAGGADAAVLLALAGGPRCVTPQGEASIRRALLAMTAETEQLADLGLLAPLARAVGIADLVGGLGSFAI